MNWSAFTKKQQMMVIGTVVLAVAQVFLLIHFLGGQAEGSGANISEQELTELENKVEKSRKMFAQSEDIKESLIETITELEELSTHVPNSSDRYAWAYEYVSRRAVKTGLELDRVDEIMYVGDEEQEAENQVYEISLSTQCGYNKLVEFLWRIESGNPLVRVKDVEISRSADGPDQQQVKVVLQWPAVLKIERGGEE